MALELGRENVQINEIVCNNLYPATVSTDIIVPDSKPDVLNILQVSAMATVREKYVQKDNLTVSGNAVYKILYLSDEDTEELKIKSISYETMFSQQVEIRGLNDNMIVLVNPHIMKVEHKISNSRKINIKCDLGLECKAINPKECEFITNICGDCDMPYQTVDYNIFNTAICQQDEFTVSDSFSIPAGNAMIDEILNVDAMLDEKDIKIVNNKVVAKGNVRLCTLYKSSEGLSFMNNDLSFTEILDVNSINSDMYTTVDYQIKGLDYHISSDSDGDSTIMEAEIKIVATTTSWENVSITALSDAYSPDYNTNIETQNIKLDKLIKNDVGQEMIKNSITIPSDVPQISNILSVNAYPEVKNVKTENGNLIIDGNLNANISYESLSDAYPVFSHSATVPFVRSVDIGDASNNISADIKMSLDKINYTLSKNNEVEIRADVSVNSNILRSEQTTIVSSVEIDTDSSINHDNMPSILIYFSKSGERLWDIAKHYHTTVDDIAQINKIEPDIVLKDRQHLLIPKRRA